jgi:hypothetical protein
VQHLVPDHLGDVKTRRAEMIDRTYSAVKDRLTKEITYWDHRAEELKAQEQSGRVNARLNSEMARRRADDLQGRLERRLAELEQERRIAPQPPVVIGGALVIPAGLLARLEGKLKANWFVWQRGQACGGKGSHAGCDGERTRVGE